MAVERQGSLTGPTAGFSILPGQNLTYRNDGTIAGAVVYELDDSNAAFNFIGSGHPKDTRAVCFEQNIEWSVLDKAVMVLSYFGITSSPTDKVVQFPGGSGQDPIETHPDFVDFAGELGDEKNGAIFDPETKAFEGFFDNTKDEFFGVTDYIVPNTQVYLSYWATSAPSARNIGKEIKANLPEIVEPATVKDWLLVGQPYRQIGSFYQVTEQWLASDENGWSTTIYG